MDTANEIVVVKDENESDGVDMYLANDCDEPLMGWGMETVNVIRIETTKAIYLYNTAVVERIEVYK